MDRQDSQILMRLRKTLKKKKLVILKNLVYLYGLVKIISMFGLIEKHHITLIWDQLVVVNQLLLLFLCVHLLLLQRIKEVYL